jgi:hypothetical protein
MRKADYLEKRFAKDQLIVSRKIAGKFVLVPIRQKAEDVESIYNMNEVGGRIWQLIDGKRRLEEIRDVIVEEFEVTPEKAEGDLVEFVEQLEAIEAIKEF